MTQDEAGARVLAWCEERGLLEKRSPTGTPIAVCERCESRIEPLISLSGGAEMEELGRPRRSRRSRRPRPLPPERIAGS